MLSVIKSKTSVKLRCEIRSTMSRGSSYWWKRMRRLWMASKMPSAKLNLPKFESNPKWRVMRSARWSSSSNLMMTSCSLTTLCSNNRKSTFSNVRLQKPKSLNCSVTWLFTSTNLINLSKVSSKNKKAPQGWRLMLTWTLRLPWEWNIAPQIIIYVTINIPSRSHIHKHQLWVLQSNIFPPSVRHNNKKTLRSIAQIAVSKGPRTRSIGPI